MQNAAVAEGFWWLGRDVVLSPDRDPGVGILIQFRSGMHHPLSGCLHQQSASSLVRLMLGLRLVLELDHC